MKGLGYKPTSFMGLNIRILLIIPIKGIALINQESTLLLIEASPLKRPLFSFFPASQIKVR